MSVVYSVQVSVVYSVQVSIVYSVQVHESVMHMYIDLNNLYLHYKSVTFMYVDCMLSDTTHIYFRVKI